MNNDRIRTVEYSERLAKRIAQHLLTGVPPEVVHGQRVTLLAPGPDEVYSVCSLSNQVVVGICTGVRMKWHASRHRIELVQLVVHPDFQRRGIARQMIRAISEHFEERGAEILQVSADGGNQAAIEAYRRMGFVEFGRLQNGLKYDDRHADEVMMAAGVDAMLDATD